MFIKITMWRLGYGSIKLNNQKTVYISIIIGHNGFINIFRHRLTKYMNLNINHSMHFHKLIKNNSVILSNKQFGKYVKTGKI